MRTWRRRPRSIAAAGGPEAAVSGSLPYMAGLDGLRALAVIGVVLYHADVAWLPAGFLGVDIFFVVSGYLITSLLIREFDARGSISLTRFWFRRAARAMQSAQGV